MQIIAQEYRDAEAYVKGALHLQVRAPLQCPRCQADCSLSVLGYYQRYVLSLNRPEALSVMVRRFVCGVCSVTVSLLPAFAQPYHLLGNDILDKVVSGRANPQLDWYPLQIFGRMLKRFGRLRQRLFALIGLGFGRDPPEKEVPDLEHLRWLWRKNEKSFRQTTQTLIRHYRSTAFGQYRCHNCGFEST